MLSTGLFLVGCIGHFCLVMRFVNYIYSFPYHRKLLKLFRMAMGFWILALPIIGWWQGVVPQLLPDNEKSFIFQVNFLSFLLLYWWVCIGIGGVVFPWITIFRLLQRLPENVELLQNTVVDIEVLTPRDVLAGNGKHSWLAKLRFNNIFQVEYTDLAINCPNLPPAWEGLSILHISDLHFYGTPGEVFYEKVFAECQHRGVPDLLIISGDIIDDDQYLPWIPKLLGQLQWKIAAFAIPGNHDWWNDHHAVGQELSRLGIQYLETLPTKIEIAGSRLEVIGHSGPWFAAPDMGEKKSADFRLLISHTPDHLNWAVRHHVDLMLSGHNHGGQIRLPIIGSIFVPSKYSRKFDMGTFRRENTALHVNRGLAGKEPLRFRCLPQVSRIVLRGQQKVNEL
ncbi:MAG: metallophosphoesterase [Zavarzinella sp.]